jgi:hypothetical protein
MSIKDSNSILDLLLRFAVYCSILPTPKDRSTYIIHFVNFGTGYYVAEFTTSVLLFSPRDHGAKLINYFESFVISPTPDIQV